MKTNRFTLIGADGPVYEYIIAEGHINALNVLRSWVEDELGRPVGYDEFRVKPGDMFNIYVMHVDSNYWGVIH